MNWIKLFTDLAVIGGIYTSFIFGGIAQEKIFSKKGKEPEDVFEYANFLILCVTFFNVIAASAVLLVKSLFNWNRGDASTRGYIVKRATESRTMAIMRDPKKFMAPMIPAVTATMAMVATTSALMYVSYPTQVVMKSAKTVPVVIGNFLIYRVVYPWYDNVTVVVVTLGLIAYNLGGGKNPTKVQGDGSTKETVIGLALLFLSLILDGVTGPRQDAIVKKLKFSSDHLMLFQNMFASLVSLIIVLCTNGLIPPISFCISHPDIGKWICVYIMVNVVGQVFIYISLVRFGSLYTALITTVRKFCSAVISVVLFRHPTSLIQWMAIISIFLSLIFQTIFKEKAKRDRAESITA